MTDCITAEEYKPENVSHTEQDAPYKAPSLTVQLIAAIKMCVIYGTASTDEIWRHFHRSKLS